MSEPEERAAGVAVPEQSDGRLPNFLIIGTMKSGTTTLRSALDAHPEAFCAREIHFFDLNFDRGIDWYRSQFAGSGASRAVGEKTPAYLYRADAVERMAQVVPDARLIVILRDPVERAYSHYWHMRRRGSEPLSFEDAIQAEDARRRNDPIAGALLSYVDQGRYVRQLERLVSSFPRASVHVVLFEDLKARPAETFAEVCRFLEIDDRVPPPPSERRANAYREYRPRWLWELMYRRRLWRRLPKRVAARLAKMMTKETAYVPMSPDTRASLRAAFAADNEALARWLGRDLSEWEG